MSDDEIVIKLTAERDRARDLAVTLENELEAAAQLIEKLNAQIEVLTGKEQPYA